MMILQEQNNNTCTANHGNMSYKKAEEKLIRKTLDFG
jgi:hypothetical protein